jgi:hypothetical protein
VLYEVSGKTKAIELPNGDVLFKNPGVRVTLTNLETGKQVTYVVTGSTRLTELEGGELLVVYDGPDRPQQSEHRHPRADRTIYLRHRRGGQLLTADGQRETSRRLRPIGMRER